MGVDYSSNMGIGFEVTLPDEIEDIDNLLEDSEYIYFEYGDCYDGTGQYCVVLDDPFKDGYNVESRMNELEAFLKEKDFIIGKGGLVGGLLIW